MERPELPGSSGEVPGRGLESSTAAAEEFQNPQVSPILRPRQQADCSSGAPTDTLEPHICSPLVCLHLLKGLCHLFHSLLGRTEGPLLLRSVKAEVRGTARRWLGLGQGLRAGESEGRRTQLSLGCCSSYRRSTPDTEEQEEGHRVLHKTGLETHLLELKVASFSEQYPGVTLPSCINGV